ncbi:CoA transferase [Mycobacteroides abscessus]|uniref:CoA transferase n=1 Tax=Mycobacteroides abscessus TaxID=36809 RepID=UPI000DDBD936
MSVTGPAPGQPIQIGVPLVDVLTGTHAVGGILAALRHRERTGQEQVNLLSVLWSALTNQTAGYLSTGIPPGIVGDANASGVISNIPNQRPPHRHRRRQR